MKKVGREFDLKAFRRKHRNTDFVNREYEIKFVAGALHKPETLEAVCNHFDSQVISSDNLKWIYDKALAFYFDNGVMLDSKAFQHVVAGRRSKPMLLTLWKKLEEQKQSCSIASTIALMEKLKRLYDARNMSLCASDIISGLSKAIESKDLASIEDIREQFDFYNDLAIKKDINISTGDPIGDYATFKEKFKKIQKDPSSIMGIPTGVKDIDKQMIGLRKGEFGVMMGRTGSGKSIFLLNVGIYAWKIVEDGEPAIITIEMPREQYNQRIYCCLSGIPYEAFRKYALNTDQWNHLDKTVEKYKKNKRKIHVIDMPEGCTVNAATTEMKKLMKHKRISLACIDYMNIMSTSSSGGISMKWEDQLELAVSLKLKFARGLHIPTWTVVQTSEKDTAFSKHIRDQLDVGCCIREDENTDSTQIKYIDWVKTRDFQGHTVSVQTRFDIMRFSGLSKDEEAMFKTVNKAKRNVKV